MVFLPFCAFPFKNSLCLCTERQEGRQTGHSGAALSQEMQSGESKKTLVEAAIPGCVSEATKKTQRTG